MEPDWQMLGKAAKVAVRRQDGKIATSGDRDNEHIDSGRRNSKSEALSGEVGGSLVIIHRRRQIVEILQMRARGLKSLSVPNSREQLLPHDSKKDWIPVDDHVMKEQHQPPLLR